MTGIGQQWSHPRIELVGPRAAEAVLVDQADIFTQSENREEQAVRGCITVLPFDAERTCESREVQRGFEEDIGAAALPLLDVILQVEQFLDLGTGVIGPGWSLDIDALPYEAAQRRSDAVREPEEELPRSLRRLSVLELCSCSMILC